MSNKKILITGATGATGSSAIETLLELNIRGVKVVLNEVALTPRASASGIKIQVENALKRDAQIDSKNITVDVQDAEITLRGWVHSWTERRDAEHAAFGAPGIARVTNLLTVSNYCDLN